MKRKIVLCLCVALCLQMTACGGAKSTSGDSQSDGLKSQWNNGDKGSDNDSTASAESIGNSIDSGKLSIDGKVYTFPSDMSDWIDSGWHISNNYSNKDEFELEPSVESTSFEMFNESDNYVTLKSYNDSQENVKLEGGIVSYLEVKFSTRKDDLAVELPGGIKAKAKKDEVIAAYGEPVDEDDDRVLYSYESDGWECCVVLEFVGDEIHSAEYYFSDDNWGSVKSADDCVAFVDDALKVSFYGDITSYVEKNFDTEEGAMALYESEVDYYAQNLMYYLDVNSEVIDEELLEGFYDLSAKVCAKFKWDMPVFKTNMMSDYAIGDAIVGDIEITLYPTDYIDIIDEAAQAVVDDFQAQHSNVDSSTLSDDELKALENEYAKNMLDAISPKVDEISYRDPVVKTYEVDTYSKEGVLTDDEWNEIDDILMDMTE